MTRLKTVLLLVTLLAGTPLLSQEPERAFKIEKLADGVYAALVVDRPPMYVFANALILINQDDVLVVDTHQSPSAARSLLAEIRKLTPKPVRTVVNTHWHGDHVWGNQIYAEAFPGVEIISHESVPGEMMTVGKKMMDEDVAAQPEAIAARRKWLETGTGPSGQPLDENGFEAVRYSLRVHQSYVKDLADLRLTPPTLTFREKMVLHRGEREIQLLHFGRAHTRGDIVMYLPQEKILAVGDLVEDAFPYTGHGYPAGWAEVLTRMAQLDAAVLLPSHGPVLHDRELLNREADLFRELAARVRQAVEEGLDLKQTQARVTLEEFRDFFTGGVEARFPSYQRNVRMAVERAWREARGEFD